MRHTVRDEHTPAGLPAVRDSRPHLMTVRGGVGPEPASAGPRRLARIRLALQLKIFLFFIPLALAPYLFSTWVHGLTGSVNLAWVSALGLTLVCGAILTYLVAGISRVQVLNRSAVEISRGD